MAARVFCRIPPDPPRRALKSPRKAFRINSRQRDRRISDDELTALLAACDKVRSSLPLGDITRFALATSLRRGEILRLRWDDVNESERTIAVRHRKHPRDNDRVDLAPLMPVHPVWPRWDALAIIKAQPRASRAELIFPYLDDTLGERFEQVCAVAGVDGVVFHLLRHESLSRYAERGFDPLRLQLIGGHRDLRHVARYAKLTEAGSRGNRRNRPD
jgi:integrase